MANGDANGERAHKQMLTARVSALATQLQNYVGDQNGRLDLIAQWQYSRDEAAGIDTST
ncbi:MAG TPA: hypothetical protein VF913_22265 [Xanthobacteraceae bacterium]